MISRGWVLVAAMVAACGDNKPFQPPDAAPDAPATDPVARGQYIMNVLGACTFCHTPLLPNGMRDFDNLLAGVDCFVDIDSPTFTDNGNGTGCLSTRNLTNHETGLKNATDEQIKNAFQNGIRTDGKKLVPVMPYWVFHNMSAEDADAVVAYLRTVPGVDHQVKANEAPFTFINDAPALAVPYIEDNQIPYPRAGDNNESAMRGRYLSSMAGLCIDCHSPEVAPLTFQLDLTRPYGGGRVFPKEQLGLVDTANTYPANIVTRNLTPHATGLEGWSRDQIRLAIAEGRDRDNNGVCAATHGGAISPYAGLEEQDLLDIVEYLYNLPPVDNDTADDNCGIPPLPLAIAAPETGLDCTLFLDEDGDGTDNDGCPETGTDCDNATDDDGDGVPNDGCHVDCGNCAGPPVP